jgi:hypothetical protein
MVRQAHHGNTSLVILSEASAVSAVEGRIATLRLRLAPWFDKAHHDNTSLVTLSGANEVSAVEGRHGSTRLTMTTFLLSS